MQKRNISKLAGFILLCVCSCASLAAQEYDIVTAYQQIDNAFLHNSADELSAVLKSYTQSRDYYLCEAYALKKTRQYIIQDKLAFARTAALIVIDNNIDNFDAIDLYSYIDKAVLAKEAEQQAEENRRAKASFIVCILCLHLFLPQPLFVLIPPNRLLLFLLRSLFP